MKPWRIFAACAAVLLVALSSFGQGTSGTIVGTVTSAGSGVPGVTVTVSSPSLQGMRTTTTGEGGAFSIPGLPPGMYDVTFELEGMQRLTRRTRVELAQTSRADGDLKTTSVAESITVTATAPSVMETAQVATTLDAQTIDNLPVNRSIRETTLLSPGVTDAGPNNQIVIGGAQSFDSLFLVNGVVVNENLRGQPQNLFIEDAIQETTILRGAISAEYGRFTGGVVTTLTKSGGNEFSGSLRDSITNGEWKNKTPFAGEADHIDQVNHSYEATLGGRIIRDRLWFFAAGRDENTDEARSTTGTNVPFNRQFQQRRYEGKLTGQIFSRHNLVGSYIKSDLSTVNLTSGTVVDLRSLVTRDDLNSLNAFQYSGVLTNNFLVEANYSKMNYSFIQGAETRDLIQGTLLLDAGNGRRMWSPTFCGHVCPPKQRDNKTMAGKASYFLSTRSFGNHEFVGGGEEFHQLRNENNYQSGSDFRIHGIIHYDGPNVFFGVNGASNSNNEIEWTPVPGLSQTSDFAVRSFYLRDKWDLSQRWSFNAGLRHDKAFGSDQAGKTTVDDQAFSPRLAATFDPQGNGKHRITASYGKYVSKVDQGPADLTATAGRYADYYFDYRGPTINPVGTPINQMVPVEEVIRRVFDWFNSVGGTANRTFLNSASVPGVDTRFEGSVKAPHMNEVTLGYGMTLGSGGYIRVDGMRRDWKDFYVIRRNLSTGIATNANGARFDVGVVENSSDDLERSYDAFQLQAAYRLFQRMNFGGNYTWSKLRGNVEGEAASFATTLTSYQTFPEYTQFEQNNPIGYLSADMRHRSNAWVDIMPPFPFGDLNVSLLHRYHSGLPYSAVGTIDIRSNATFYGAGQPGGVTNPGYVLPPTNETYFFSERGELRTEDVHSTDVALRYTIPISRVGITFMSDITNVFDNDAIEDPDFITTTVQTRRQVATLPGFNPVRGDQPTEGVHWRKVATFGAPTSAFAYQVPRTYRFSVRVKF
jgi:hypothetical protein